MPLNEPLEDSDPYTQHASELTQFYNQRPPLQARRFLRQLEPGKRVLDLGCGSGRDLNEFLEAGLDAWGVEPSGEMRELAVRNYPWCAGRVLEGRLPAIKLTPDLGPFDGIFCNAVFQHLADGEVIPAFSKIKELLSPGGLFFFSVPLKYPLNKDGKDLEFDRTFHLRPRAFWVDLTVRYGYHILSEEIQEDTRPDRKWLSLTVQKKQGTRPGALEVFASVMGKDSKTTTYKFALIRALADLALANRGGLRWEEEVVAVPLEQITHLWVEYYYPLVTAENFLPQGNQPEGKSDIAFRQELAELSSRFGSMGGLFALKKELHKPHPSGDLKSVLRKIRRALVEGPVTFAGNDAVGGKLFRHNKEEVLVPVGLWAELGRYGSWIRDAVLLQWADYIKNCCEPQSGIRTGDILDSLMNKDAVRNQQEYRSLMDQARQENPRSLWSSGRLNADFHVDHIIPFSLWGNNDLWNLAPVLPKENLAKSDLLPSLQLLTDSRERLSAHWHFLDRQVTDLFRWEVAGTLGVRIDSWSSQSSKMLFDALVSSVELTAQATGSLRWEG